MLFMLVRGSWQSCLADARQVAVKEIPVETEAELNEFAKEAPATTILINYDQLNSFDKMDIWIDPKAEANGFSEVDSLKGYPGLNGEDLDNHPFVIYTPEKNDQWPEIKDYSSIKKYSLGEQDKTLFTFRFRDGAKLPDGTNADVVVSYSNITLYLSNSVNPGVFKNAVFSIASGILFRAEHTVHRDNIDEDKKLNYGITADVHIEIQDSKKHTKIETITIGNEEGKSINEPATFLYTVTDIDVKRDNNTPFSNLNFHGAEYNYFSEQIAVYDHSIASDSEIYVPSFEQTRYVEKIKGNVTFYHFDEWNRIETKGGGWRFIKQFPDNYYISDPDPGTYSSGFVTVVDNSKGLDLTVTASGRNNRKIRTWIFGRPKNSDQHIQHRIKSETGRGGNIYTTKKGDPEKQLPKKLQLILDKKESLTDDTLYSWGIYTFTDGHTITYTMKPDEGCAIKKIEVYDEVDADPKTAKPDWKINADELNQMVPGTQIKDIHLKDDRRGILECVENGMYTFTFPNNNHDHYIKVTWEKKVNVNVTKKWEDRNNIYEKRPASVDVTLEQIAGDTFQPVDTGTIRSENNWELTFTNLPAWDENEKDIKYVVREVSVPEYDWAVSGNASDGFTITNTLKTVDIAVEKKWDGDLLSDRPETVTIQLLADKKVKEIYELRATENWQHTFTGLPEYSNGKHIDYDVQEVRVRGYQTSVQESREGKKLMFTVTNRKLTNYIPSVSLELVKYLNGPNRAAGFSFGLYEYNEQTGQVSSDPIVHSTTNQDGRIRFDTNKLHYTKAGLYHYLIDEYRENNPAVDYDEHPVHFFVDVREEKNDAGAPVLSYSTYYYKEDVLLPYAQFENTFHASGTGIIRVSKSIENRTWMPGESFTFTLTPENGAPLRTMDGQTHTSLTAVARYDGHKNEAVFENLLFTQDDLLVGDRFVQDREFIYKIVENIPDEAVNQVLNGLTYDAAPRFVTVHVHNTRQSDRLEITYGDNRTGTIDAPKFVNVYRHTPVSLSLKVTKQILDHTGKAMDEWKEGTQDWTQTDFSFELTPKSKNAPMPDNLSAAVRRVNSDARTLQYGKIDFLKPGRYFYQVRELAPEVTPEEEGDTARDDSAGPVYDNLFYDLIPHAVEVVVEDDYQGHLLVKNVYYDGIETDSLMVSNRVLPDAYTYIRAMKTISGASYIQGAFNFWLADDLQPDAEPEMIERAVGTNREDGIVEFTALTFDHDELFPGCTGAEAAREIHYIMEEVDKNVPGWEYDNRKVHYRVTISHPGGQSAEKHHIYVSKVEYSEDGKSWKTYHYNDPETYPSFVNTYNNVEGTAALFAEKRISGREWRAEDRFEFILTGEDNAPLRIQKEDGSYEKVGALSAVAHAQDKTAEFAMIHFVMEDLKNDDGSYDISRTFTYRIHETDAGSCTDGSFTDKGMTYAPDQLVQVTITNNKTTGRMDVTYRDGRNVPHLNPFINYYEIMDEKTVQVGVFKQIRGRKWRRGDSFTFRINPLLNDAGLDREDMPMPEEPTMTIAASSNNVQGQANTKSGLFGNMTFTHPGIYEYEIGEVVPDQPEQGMTYAQARHRVVITVKDRGDGTLMEPEIRYPGTDSDLPTTFINISELDDDPGNMFRFWFVKEWRGQASEIRFTLYNSDGIPVDRRFTAKKLSDREVVYEAWLPIGEAYYVIEEPMTGYATYYVNGGPNSEVNDRVFNGGKIINSEIPKTGDHENGYLYAGMLALCFAGLCLYALKSRPGIRH